MKIKDARIVYMGTPEFAVPALEALHRAGAQVGLVFTQPDKSRDRGKRIQATPVKIKAEELGIEVLQPYSIKEDLEVVEKIRRYEPDLIVVAAYGQILNKEILDIPRRGVVNIHGSLLPRWRGAAPIQHAVWAGDEKTGITLMQMEEGLDSGDMIAFSETEVGRKTAGELYDELSHMGAALLIEKLNDILSGTISPCKQDETQVSYAAMIFKADGALDFSKGAEELDRQVRALNPAPGAYTYYDGALLKVWKAEPMAANSSEAVGAVMAVSDKGIDIATGDGVLRLKEVQLSGKKRMAVSEFIKGNKIKIGKVLKTSE